MLRRGDPLYGEQPPLDYQQAIDRDRERRTRRRQDSPAARTKISGKVESGRRIGVNDLWIASVAVSRGLPVVTQDDDFDVLAELGLVEVVRV